MRLNTVAPSALPLGAKTLGKRARTTSLVCWLVLAWGCPCASAAQTEPPAAQGPAASEAGASPAANLPASPVVPVVDDAMLVPPLRPQRELSNWNEAVVELRSRSTNLATAYAEVVKAEAQSRIALAALLPTINGSATATHQFITNRVTQITNVNTSNNTQTTLTTTTPASDYITGNVTLVQDVIDAKAWHDLGTARAAEVVQRLGVESVRRTMTLSLATSIVAVVTAERVAEINRIALRSALELLDLTNKKKTLGTATGLDVVRAQQNVATARATIVTGDESLRQAREALGLALGEAQQVAVASTMKIDGVLDSIGQYCHRLNNSNDRPELAAARQQLAVTERGIRSVELSFLPTLKGQSTVSSSTLNPGAAPRTTWNIQAVLTVPIWDGGARYGSLRSARAVRDEAGYSFEAMRRSVTIEVEQARRSVEVAEQSVAVARNAAVLAARNDELTRISYRLGQGVTSFELVAAAVALQQAQVQLAVQEFGVVGARLTALLTMARCTD